MRGIREHQSIINLRCQKIIPALAWNSSEIFVISMVAVSPVQFANDESYPNKINVWSLE